LVGATGAAGPEETCSRPAITENAAAFPLFLADGVPLRNSTFVLRVTVRNIELQSNDGASDTAAVCCPPYG